MPELPESYYFAVGLFCCLVVYSLPQIKTPWGTPFLAVLCTIAVWYFIEPIYLPEEFQNFDPDHVEIAYLSVFIFLVTLPFVMPPLVRAFLPRDRAVHLDSASVSGERVLNVLAVGWLVLLAYGVYRMEGNLFGALFPLKGRAGSTMWSRAAGADAGADGFIVSTASYVYMLMLASFGVLYTFVHEPRARSLAITLMVVGWPYAFLQGSRNIALAVVIPGVLAFLLFGRIPFWVRALSFDAPPWVVKFLTASAIFLVIELALRLMIAFRHIGIDGASLAAVDDTRHKGLNMASELVYCIKFIESGEIALSYGIRYLAELTNIIPRVIWSEKPLLGIDYAIARGYGSASNDIGVSATISSGVIGQGVLSFGPFVGPIAAALLMGLWIALLARFRAQGTPLRLCLFLVGLGLTFNLGRELTLLVLWPMIFAYLGVKLFESAEARRRLTVARQNRPRNRHRT